MKRKDEQSTVLYEMASRWPDRNLFACKCSVDCVQPNSIVITINALISEEHAEL